MPSYTVRAYRPDGGFAFGVTLHCAEDSAAVAKFRSLPLGGHAAELLRGKRRIAARSAAEAAAAARQIDREDRRLAAASSRQG